MNRDKMTFELARFLKRARVRLIHLDYRKPTRLLLFLFVALVLAATAPPPAKTLGLAVDLPEQKESTNPTPPTAPPPPTGPQYLADSPPMASISARAVYVIDSETKTPLFEKNADWRLPMASLTKIMTALVVLEQFALDEVVTVPELCTTLPPNKIDLAAGERLTVEALLYGMLVSSASDAACALSHHYRGDFLELMNKKAQKLGLTNTAFANEVGLDGVNGDHYSTARDLVLLAQEASQNGEFRKIVGTRRVIISNIEKTRWHELTSTNKLLWTLPGIIGIKTGYTDEAKGCLAIAYEKQGREIIGVLLSSEDRFGDMQTVLDWVFTAFRFPSNSDSFP